MSEVLSMVRTANITTDKVSELMRNPAALKPDDLPILRFIASEEVDRLASDAQKRTVYRDVVYVYIRARGDTKNELKELVRGWAVTSREVPVQKEEVVYRDVRQPDGSYVREEQTIINTANELFFSSEPATPWFDKMEEKVHHGFISREYFNYCKAAFEAWENQRQQPLDGTPVNGWNQISHAQQRNLIELGYNTIERVAKMSSEGITAFGMGAMDIKRQAENYLKSLPGSDAAYELKKLQDENYALAHKAEKAESLMSEYEKKLAELEARQTEFENKPKRGRKPKKDSDEPTNDSTGNDE